MAYPSHPFDLNRLRFVKRRKEFPNEKGEFYDVFYFEHVGFIEQWPDATDWRVSIKAESRYGTRDKISSLEEAKEVAIELLEQIYG